MYRCYLSPFAFPCGKLDSELALEKADNLGMAITVSNEILFLLPRNLIACVSIHESVASNLLVYKKGKILDPS